MSVQPGLISGEVFDEDGNPVEGAVVVIKRQSDNKTFETTTDVSGFFEFTGLPGGDYHAMARYDNGVEEFNSLSKPYLTIEAAFTPTESDSKLIHRWVLNDADTSTIEDVEGTADGTNNGVVSVSGDWEGGSAGQGDGSSAYIELTDLDQYGADLSNNWALSFSVQMENLSNLVMFLGANPSADGTQVQIRSRGRDQLGDISVFLSDSSGNNLEEYTNQQYDDGGKYRVVINKTGNTAGDIDFWVSREQKASTNFSDGGYSNPSDIEIPFYMFAHNNQGSPDFYFPGVLDDFCIFNDSLTQGEIESYERPWIEGAGLASSAVNRWKFDEGTGATAADSIGGSDATLEGTAGWTSNNYVGGSAVQADNSTSNYIQTGGWDVDVSAGDDFAVAFTLETSDQGLVVDGQASTGYFAIQTDGSFTGEPGRLNLMLWNNGDRDRHTSFAVTDGTRRRFVINKITDDPTNWEIWSDGAEDNTQTNQNDAWDGPPTLGNPRYLNDAGGVLDNLIVYNSSLSASEVSEDYDAQPWT